MRNLGRSRLSAILLGMALAAPAHAQVGGPPPIPPGDIPPGPPSGAPVPLLPGMAQEPALGVPDRSLSPAAGAGLPDAISPYAAPDLLPDLGGLDLSPQHAPELVLSARLTDDGPALRSGVVWRVFAAKPGADGKLPLVAQANGGTASLRLDPGTYLVHCGFGYAGRTDRIELGKGIKEAALVLNAGGLVLQAEATEDRPLKTEAVRFDIFSMETDEHGERKAVARDVKPGEMVRLAADTYYVVSRYGSVNAQTHADVDVKAGKLSEVTLYQKAAEVTLKLVGAPGGEAIADTKWSILTPGGDVVTEGVGAFPSFILAAGGYTVIARHDDQVFQRDFEVESGEDGEVEVIADKAEQPPSAD